MYVSLSTSTSYILEHIDDGVPVFKFSNTAADQAQNLSIFPHPTRSATHC
jgi:hypothetical protein